MLCVLCMTVPVCSLLRLGHGGVHCKVVVKICRESKKVIGV